MAALSPAPRGPPSRFHSWTSRSPMASARAITRGNRVNAMFTRAVSFYGGSGCGAVLERPIVAQGCDRLRRMGWGRVLLSVLVQGGGQGLAHVVTKRLRREDFDVRRVAHQEQ